MMRSDKLGYNAPIVVYDRKFYRYEDENYSITDIPLTENDMNILSETVEMLKQFKDFSLFSELGGIIQRLEDKVYTEKTHQASIIHLDKNENLKGLQQLDLLYQAILKKIVLRITYQSFKARKASEIIFHPFILKEYNNRWFLIGVVGNKPQISTFALDRIVEVDYDLDIPYRNENFNGDDYYKNTIGVTVLHEKHIQEIILRIDKSNAPYVVTKPFHYTQEVLKTHEDESITVKLNVHINFELERLILGFGDTIEVIEPRVLRKRIRRKLENAVKKYMEE
jgi:predicted DNA-binding transcriptional regulator YafY